jgi:hypothetical protein
MLTYSYGFASDYSLAVELHHVGRCNLAGQHVVLEDGRLSVGLVPRPDCGVLRAAGWLHDLRQQQIYGCGCGWSVRWRTKRVLLAALYIGPLDASAAASLRPGAEFSSVLGMGAEVIARAACSRFFTLQGCAANPCTWAHPSGTFLLSCPGF